MTLKTTSHHLLIHLPPRVRDQLSLLLSATDLDLSDLTTVSLIALAHSFELNAPLTSTFETTWIATFPNTPLPRPNP